MKKKVIYIILAIVIIFSIVRKKTIKTSNIETSLIDLGYSYNQIESMSLKEIDFIILNNITYPEISTYIDIPNFDIENYFSYITFYQESPSYYNYQMVVNYINNPSFISTTYTLEKEALYQNSLLILINKTYKTKDDFKPSSLQKVAQKYVVIESREIYINNQVFASYLNLYKDAKKEKIDFYIFSGYRSYSYQKYVYDLNRKDDSISARPGHSEHQSGLALDISTKQYGLTELLGDSFEGNWLEKNAHKYGFIIRYPKNKEKITGYLYEPWHLRYVGKDVAKIIYLESLTFEEYLLKYKIIK